MKKAFLSLLLLLSVPAFAEDDLATRLVSPLAEVREHAVTEYRTLPLAIRERFVQSLMVAMSDDNPQVRGQAAKLIKELGVASRPKTETPTKPRASDAEAVQAREQERAKTLQSIQAPKTDRYQNLKAELQNEKETQPEWMAVKGQASQDNLKSTLLAGLGDTDPFMRSRSARRLQILNPMPSEALPLLEPMLSDPDPDCRAAAAIALSAYGPEAHAYVSKIGTLTHDSDEKVRIAARESLRQIQGLP